jgi:hypothetical protein
LFGKCSKRNKPVKEIPIEETVEPEEEKSPCPQCGVDLKNSVLDCFSCKNVIPYCIATVLFPYSSYPGHAYDSK